MGIFSNLEKYEDEDIYDYIKKYYQVYLQKEAVVADNKAHLDNKEHLVLVLN